MPYNTLHVPSMLLRHIVNLVVVGVGILALPFGVWFAWKHGITAADGAIFLGMYLATGMGITMGYHRLFSHRSFEARPWLRYTLAILGSAAAQGPVIEWVADHRKHHAFSDREGDPHSPHVGRGNGLFAAWTGYWHSHLGWLFRTQGLAGERTYAPDLLADPILVRIENWNTIFILLSFLLSFGAGYLAGSWHGALTGLFWGGVFRYGMFQQALFTVNAMGHFWGQRPFRTADRSCNVGWMALPVLGDAWHCNHHTFPASAVIGFHWWQLDLTGLAIRALEALGLVWNVKEVPVELRERFSRTGTQAAPSSSL
jgi:stearoyl-CoA desaturase (Delta-9 desaturase)